ncbi:MAG TPA: formate dehydrogenase subunit beta [Candidatus Dormibacteraeota bacterium]|nr:formate dehydrogenase subunit beta [Candidatus Dormibacteraeota bacterium]
MAAIDIIRRSATSTAPPQVQQAEPSVAKLIDISKCIGCKACQAACMEWNDLRDAIGTCDGTLNNPTDLTSKSWTVMRFTEVESSTGMLDWLIRKDGCMHCEDPGCLKACPSPGAVLQYRNGIVDFDESKCIGCGYCITGCPFNVPRLDAVDGKAYKCTLCVDRVGVGLEPACVKACPTGALMFGTKTDMRHEAEGRLTDLKRRGFTDASLYDPPGVGGTHVMYVLPQKAEMYPGLPPNPSIDPLVNFWKGVTKPLMSAVLGLAALTAFFHYVTVGPNDVKNEDDEEKRDA